MELFLSAFSICIRDLDWAHEGVGAFTESAKAGILYIENAGNLGTIGLPWSCRRSHLETANEPQPGEPPRGQSTSTFAIGLKASEPAQPRRAIPFCAIRLFRPPKELVVDPARGAWQPETFPKTATYCHLLPFWSLKTAKSVAFLSVPLALGRTGKPEIRAWNRERAERGLRWNGAIECRVSHDCADVRDCVCVIDDKHGKL